MAWVTSGFVLLTAPALAQDDRPRSFPARDAAVTYRVTGPATLGGEGDVLQIAYLAAERKQRMDTGPGSWLVIERATSTGLRVEDGSRTALRVPLPPAVMAQFAPPDNATVTRGADERVAGLSCTLWSYRSDAFSGRLCLTADGLPLRMETTLNGQAARAQATEVRIAPQDPARFRVPAGYQLREAVPPRGRPPRG